MSGDLRVMTKNVAPGIWLGVAKHSTTHETASTTEKRPATGVNSLGLRNAGLTPQNLPLWLKVSLMILFLKTPRGGITKDSHHSPRRWAHS